MFDGDFALKLAIKDNNKRRMIAHPPVPQHKSLLSHFKRLARLAYRNGLPAPPRASWCGYTGGVKLYWGCNLNKVELSAKFAGDML